MNKAVRLLRRTILIALLGILVAVWITPTVWAFVASTRPSMEPVSRGDTWFGSTLTLESYFNAFRLAPFARYFFNTTILVVMVFGVQIVTVTLAAFAFAHFDFRGKKLLFMFILLQMMIPTTALLVPNFSTIRVLGIYDTILAIGIPYFGSAFGTFLMRQTFLGIPKSLVEAGIIDGCSWHQLLFHVYLPPAVPTVVAFGISSVNWHWSEFLWPLIITKSSQSRPLTAGLVRFTQLGEIGARWSLLSAATVIVILPLLVAFLIFQKRFIQGFLHSGLK